MVSPEELVGPDRERQLLGAEILDVDTAKDGIMVRSEERLAVDTQRVVIGRARLRKYKVTEEQQITVTVAHEQVRVEQDTDVPQHAHDGAVPGSGRGAVDPDTNGAPAAGTDDLDHPPVATGGWCCTPSAPS